METVESLVKAMSSTEIEQLKRFIVDREFELGTGQYSGSKIYNIVHKSTGVIAYTGSTIRDLPTRWGGHKSYFKNCPDSNWSQYVSDNGGPDEFEIVLVKDCPCRTFLELLQIERDCISSYKPVCNIMLTKPTHLELKWKRLTSSVLDRSRDKLRLRSEAIRIQYITSLDTSVETEDKLFDILNSKNERQFLINALVQVQAPVLKVFPTELPPSKQLLLINNLYQLLGIRHAYDTETKFKEDVLIGNSKALAELVKEYQRDACVKKSTASVAKTEIQALKLNIDTVLKHWAGSKLKGSFSRSRSEGHQKRRWLFQVITCHKNVLEVFKQYERVAHH